MPKEANIGWSIEKMKIIDDYLDGYLARKILWLFQKHFGEEHINGNYDNILQEYTIEYSNSLTSKRLWVFSRKASLMALRYLLTEGWGSFDNLISQGED